jgi:hypothetical protein
MFSCVGRLCSAIVACVVVFTLVAFLVQSASLRLFVHHRTWPDDQIDLIQFLHCYYSDHPNLPGFTMPARRFLCDVYDVSCLAGIKEKWPQRGSNSCFQCMFAITCYKSCQYSCLKVRVLQNIYSNI